MVILTRTGEILKGIQDLEETGTDGAFSGMGLLIFDAVLAGDGRSLLTAHKGLLRLHREVEFTSEQTVRILGMTDVTGAALRRMGAWK